MILLSEKIERVKKIFNKLCDHVSWPETESFYNLQFTHNTQQRSLISNAKHIFHFHSSNFLINHLTTTCNCLMIVLMGNKRNGICIHRFIVIIHQLTLISINNWILTTNVFKEKKVDQPTMWWMMGIKKIYNQINNDSRLDRRFFLLLITHSLACLVWFSLDIFTFRSIALQQLHDDDHNV